MDKRSMEEDTAHNEESYEENNIVQSVVPDIEWQVSTNAMHHAGNEKLLSWLLKLPVEIMSMKKKHGTLGSPRLGQSSQLLAS